ncbi:MAG: SDR family oxidoreductase [Bdellovibrionota bacterium]
MEKPVAVVTGAGWWEGQSPGLGWAIALELAGAGRRVVVLDKEQTPADRSAEDLRKRGYDASGMALDVTDPFRSKEVINQIISQYGRIDALANAAALTMHKWGLKNFHEITPDQCDIEINVTLRGALNVTRAALPYMYAQKSGAVVFVGSVLAFDPAPKQAVYGLCKAALVSLTASLAGEAGPNGVRVNCVCPGIMKTRVTDKLPEKYMDTFTKRTALGRISDPREVARVARFLCSEEASYVNGVSIRVDGGQTGAV